MTQVLKLLAVQFEGNSNIQINNFHSLLKEKCHVIFDLYLFALKALPGPHMNTFEQANFFVCTKIFDYKVRYSHVHVVNDYAHIVFRKFFRENEKNSINQFLPLFMGPR